jgi:hypothetical protein
MEPFTFSVGYGKGRLSAQNYPIQDDPETELDSNAR